MDQPLQKPDSVGQRALGILASIVGIGLGIYTGMELLWPLALIGVTWWLAAKLVPEEKQIVIPTFAVQCGHALYMSLNFAVLRFVDEGIIDVVLWAGGLTWLLARPGRGPLFFLSVVQIIALIAVGYMLVGAEVGTSDHKAALVNIMLRTIALFFMLRLLLRLGKAGTEPAVGA